MDEAKGALWMRGVQGPAIAILATFITSTLSMISPEFGVTVNAEAGTVTINVAQALGVAATIVIGSALGIYGRLKAKSGWNGKAK